MKSVLLEFCEDEAIDVVGRPSAVGSIRDGRFAKRFEGPMIGVRDGRQRKIVRARIWRAESDPLFEERNLGGFEAMLWRHLKVLVCVTDGFDEETFVGLPGNDDLAGVAAFEEVVARVEKEAAFGLFGGAVTFVAAFNEDGADALFKEIETAFSQRGMVRSGQNQACEQRSHQRFRIVTSLRARGGGFEQKIGDVQDANLGAGFVEAGLNLEDAAGVAGDDDRGAGLDDVMDLAALEAFGHFRFGEIVTARAAAADFGFREFDVVGAGDGFDEITGLACDSLRMSKMTGVVVGNQFAVETG